MTSIISNSAVRRPRSVPDIRLIFPSTVLGLIALASVGAGIAAPYDPMAFVGMPYQPPGSAFWLGTDGYGRDVLSRIMYAGRISLSVAVASVAIAGTVGIVSGLIAGYKGGWAEAVIMRIMDLVMSFPTMILAIAVVGILGPSSWGLVFVIGVLYVPRFARVVYGATLSVRSLEYVEAARSMGASTARILLDAILRNITAPIIVQATLSLAAAILLESGLSFLGLGAQPPTPSWGNMVSEARGVMEIAPWLVLAPGGALTATILALCILGDTLRDVLDPRLRAGGQR